MTERNGADEAAFIEQLRSAIGENGLRRLGIYPIPADFKLSVVMPVYNEENTIRAILQRVHEAPVNKEIIAVDDGSKDGTRAILDQIQREGLYPELRVILHERNQGKGAALSTGFQHVTGDVVIIQDADLEYDPSEYLRLLQPIIEGRADVVYGSRFIGHVARVHLFWHRVANGLLTFLSNMFTNLNLTDMETCYKVFRSEVLRDVRIRERRFGVEPELTAKIARRRRDRRWRIYEMPISYHGRDYAEGKHIGWRDAIRAFYCIVRYWIAD